MSQRHYQSPMINFDGLTTSQLHRIIAIKERIEKLQSQIDSIAANGKIAAPSTVEAPKKRRRSAAVRAKMAAAARATWAKIKGEADAKPAKKGKRRLSAAGRAAIIAGTKARWAQAKAAKKKDRRSSTATRAKLAAAARARWARVKAEGKKTL
jgi:hypothetical protein